MNIILKNFVIILSPIFYHYPQIKKIISNKSDLGFSSERLTLNYCSIFIEMILNLSSNKNNLVFFNLNNRLPFLIIDMIGNILKFAVINKYSVNKSKIKKNINFIFQYSLFNLTILLPLALITNSSLFNTILSFVSFVFSSIGFIPQIKEIVKIKKSGSLSYITTILEYLGNWGIIVYLFNKSYISFFNLFPYIINNLFLCFLVSLIIYYDYNFKIQLFLNNFLKKKYNKDEEKDLINNSSDDDYDKVYDLELLPV